MKNCVNSGDTQTHDGVGNPEPSLILRKVQRLSRKGVGLSDPKRTAPVIRVMI